MSSDEPRYLRFLRAVMHVADPAWWDGLILGLAVAAAPFIVWLWLTGN